MSSSLSSGTCASQSIGRVDSLATTLLQVLLIGQCSISPPSDWPKDHAQDVLQKCTQTYDFVVVGAGTAGSVVASRLSENSNYSILVLEAGGDPPAESQIPAFYRTLQKTNVTWNYYDKANNRSCLGFVNERCYWPRGKMIGGTGGANGMIHIRGNEENYNTWADMGNPDWSYEKVFPYFKFAETNRGNASHPMGYASVEPFVHFYEDIRSIFTSASEELNLPSVKEFVKGSYIGISNVPGTVKNNRRASTGKTYLAAVDERPNLIVVKNAFVKKINFNANKDKVTSVTYELNGKTLKVQVKKELILSAGSINSPLILMQSGIGPREHLESLNISVVKDLSVGDNLQDHLAVPSFIKLNNKTDPLTNKTTMENFINVLLNNPSPLDAPNILYLMQFVNLIPGSKSPYPDIQYYNSYLQRGDLSSISTILDKWGYKEKYVQQILQAGNKTDLFLITPVLLQPKSKGQIKLKSANFKDEPIINSGYLDEVEDVDSLVRGMQFVDKEIQTKAFQSVGAERLHIKEDACDQYEFRSDEYYVCFIKYFGLTSYHPVGTIKMGNASDPTACVDQKLRVYGISNLRVIDASVMPKIVSANTNAATIMIAERGSEFITNFWKTKKQL